MEDLKEKTAKGLFWGMLNNSTTQILNAVIGIFLGRLLTPAEYGIVGVLTIFTAVAGAIQASGFTQGLINLKKPTDKDYNAVFWFNISVSMVLYAILFVCAPLIASHFHQPCLVEVSRVVFLCLPISALGITSNAYMLKNMMNRELAIINFIALCLSGFTGIMLALNGFSYWSLVCQQLLYITLTNIGRYYYVRWMPSLKIDFTPVKEMYGFCVKLMITNIINTLNQHYLTFIFGGLFPIKAVGNYSQANKWNTMASSTISGTIGQVAQPVLVSINDEQDREVRVFRKLLRFTAFLSFPAMFGLALVSREFILLTIGAQWLDSIPMLQILCLSGAFLPFYSLYQNVTITAGKSNIYMWCNICQILIQLAMIATLYQQGIIVLISVYSAFTVLWLLVWQMIAQKLIGIKFIDALKDTIPFMVISLAVMAATYYLTSAITNHILLLFSRVLLAGLLYVLIMRLTGAKVFEECINFILKRQPAK